MKVLTVTGYKPMELNIFKVDDHRITFIKAAIRKRLIAFIEEGLEWVLISGQMGVELWAAEVVRELREQYDVKLAIIPPFESQEERFPEPIQQQYQELVSIADFYKPLYVGYYKGAFQFKAKNKWLIDKSDGCLIVMDEEFPGSGRFFYLEAKGWDNYPVYSITPADLDDVVEELRMADPDYWT
ncbi:DUF1273 family protein [Virgibacillus dakarensis]|uniref:UPF0398 protein YpsA n=1 Tax=Lentibacillus populi TaxID=1827502 RepID=A0A9W5TYV9_9BACI|nr:MULTISPECIES: DUF1273 domain-containing protein [Bacillaceae]MBT2216410.1 DUF1273 domain-containing protein [Virgibacillus dakarensis]MTW86601.1 DUF1273 family protein [Virgibacillus dakarensis]GGB47288.1 UPF0398 protein YpsA [Lentibacillus populi]